MLVNPDAKQPSELRWKDYTAVLKRAWRDIQNDHLSLLAGGVAFYAFLSLFPALAAIVSIYGFVSDPAEVREQMSSLGGLFPAKARSVLEDQLEHIASSEDRTLGIGVVLSILLAIWSANKATKGLFLALSVVYGEKEERSVWRLNINTLLMTFSLVLFCAVAIALVAIFPAVIDHLGLRNVTEIAASAARWPILLALVLVTLAVVYRYGPDRDAAKWQWVTPGSLLAGLVWLAVSAGFSLYVDNFDNYNDTYGSMGAVAVLLLWLFISAFVVLLGGELNAGLEHQTLRDTTSGPPKPMGQRGAYVADTFPTPVGKDPWTDSED